MSKFKDNHDVSWKVKLTIGTIKKVKEDTEINIGKFLDDDFAVAKQVLDDPLTLFLVLWSLCESQAKERGITAEQFGDRLYGDVLNDAKEALWDAFLDFCPSQQRQVLQTLMAKTKDMQVDMLKQMEEMEPKDLISFAKRTNPPESAGLRQMITPRENSTIWQEVE